MTTLRIATGSGTYEYIIICGLESRLKQKVSSILFITKSRETKSSPLSTAVTHYQIQNFASHNLLQLQYVLRTLESERVFLHRPTCSH